MLEFIIGGTQKAATTWLYLSLRDHSGVQVPEKKMEWKYVGGDWYEQHGLEALEQRFSLDHGVRGHVSVQYLADARCAKALFEVAPKCKLVFVLREPVDRLTSAYSWYWRRAQMDKSLREAVQLGLVEPDSNDGVNRSFCRDLIERGFYGRQLNRYLECFPPEQLLILTFDDVCKNRKAVWARVQQFIGCDDLEEVFHVRSSAKQNSGVGWLISFERRFSESRVVAHIANILHQFFVLMGCRGKKASLSGESREALEALYREDLKLLQSDKMRDVGGWPELNRVVERWLERAEV